MKILTVRMEDTQYDELARVARSRGVSISEVARTALDDLLTGKAMPQRPREIPESPETLSALDRRTLALLHRILGYVMPDGAGSEDGDLEYQRMRAQVLEKGWTAEYSDEFIEIESELSRADCTFVMDVLDMFTHLEWSYEQLSDDDREELGDRAKRGVRFPGFDFNDPREGQMASYAKHLIDQGKWATLAPYFGDQHEHGNSHSPMIGTYSRMWKVFEPIWRQILSSHNSGYTLSSEQIRQVLEAR